MELVARLVTGLFSLKVYVLLPLLFLAIGLLVGMRPLAAAAASLRVGAGFAAVFLSFEAFLASLKPAIAAMAAARGLSFPVIDAGWPPLAAITWSSWIAPAAVLVALGVNLLLVLARLTTVLYLDVWNCWHFALIASMLVAGGAHPALALGAAAFAAFVMIKIAEWCAPYVRREMGLEGIAVSPMTVAGLLPWAVLVDRAVEAVPPLRGLRWDPSRGKGRLAKAGDPMVVGFALGLLFGLLAGYGAKATLELAVRIAAVMFLLPRCGALIGEGTGEISRAAQARLAPLLGGRKILVAMDTGFLMNNPSVIATGLVLMPLVLLLAMILPGNRILPAADLPNLISIMSVTTIVCGGNVFRAVLAALPMTAAFMYVAGALAPRVTAMAAASGAVEPGLLVSSFTDAGNPLRFWILELFSGSLLGFALIPLAAFLLWFAGRRSARLSKELDAAAEGKPAAPEM